MENNQSVFVAQMQNVGSNQNAVVQGGGHDAMEVEANFTTEQLIDSMNDKAITPDIKAGLKYLWGKSKRS